MKIIQWSNLTSGFTISCGCYKKEENIQRLSKTGRKSLAYNSYYAMLQRCYNIKNDRYYNYGGRGMTVCDRWRSSFDNFYEDMGDRPYSTYSIERLNKDGNYEPSNCIWANNYTQYRNRTDNVYYEHDGRKMISSDWMRELNINLSSIHYHMKKGLSFSETYKLLYMKKQKKEIVL